MVSRRDLGGPCVLVDLGRDVLLCFKTKAFTTKAVAQANMMAGIHCRTLSNRSRDIDNCSKITFTEGCRRVGELLWMKKRQCEAKKVCN